MKTILHIAPDFNSSQIYKSLFSKLYDLGWEQRVFVADNIGNHPSANDLPYSVYQYPTSFNKVERALFFPKQHQIAKFTLTNKLFDNIDIVHAHLTFSAGYAAWRHYQKNGTPYIVAVRNTDLNIFFRKMPWLRRIGISILRDSKKIVFISPAYQTRLQEYVPQQLWDSWQDKMVIIPNGVDPYFLTHKQHHAPSEEALRLIMVGKLSRKKNVDRLITSSNLLRQKGFNVALTLVGTVNDPAIEPLLQQPFITHIPFCEKEQVCSLLQKNDIFVMPSLAESFGLVYVEALTQGLPIIYTRGEGIDGYFSEGEVGYAVAPHDPQDIATKILTARRQYEQISARTHKAIKQFQWDTIAEQYESIYTQFI